MRKAILLAAAATFALGLSTAKADVYVDPSVYKRVDIDIIEYVNKLKLVYINVFVYNEPDEAAESGTYFNQRSEWNKACENCAEKWDLIKNSINDNSGIVSVNQASGNMNNQGSALSFAFADASGRWGFADSQVGGAQINAYNLIDTIGVPDRHARIESSVNNNKGIVMFNQATGNMNNQANGISLAVTHANGVALSDAALSQTSAFNSMYEQGVAKDALLINAMNGNHGIIAGNQSAGNFGNQANVISIAVTGF